MKKAVVIIVVILFTSASIGMYLDLRKKEEQAYQEVLASGDLPVESPKIIPLDREKPPPGVIIKSNGTIYVWHIVAQDFTTSFKEDSYKDAVKAAWSFYDYENKPPEVWTTVQE